MTKIVPVEDFYVVGLTRQLSQILKTNVLYVNAADKVREIQKLKGGNKVEYPLVFLSLTSFSDTNRVQSTRRLGMAGVPFQVDPQGVVRNVRLFSACFNMEVEYRTNAARGAKSVMEFARQWRHLGRRGGLQFSFAYGERLKLTANFEVDRDIVIPELQLKGSEVAEYAVKTSLKMHGYTSEPVIRTTALIDTVELGLDVKTLLEAPKHLYKGERNG